MQSPNSHIKRMKDTDLEMTLYNAMAHVFEIDPQTKQSWLPKGESTIPIAFVVSRRRDDSSVDSSTSERVLKLIAADRGNVVLESVITPNMVFQRRTEKFCQWVDQRANSVYGLGFNTELEMEDFCKTFQHLQLDVANQAEDETRSNHSLQATNRTPSTNSTINNNHHTNNNSASTLNNNNVGSSRPYMYQPHNQADPSIGSISNGTNNDQTKEQPEIDHDRLVVYLKTEVEALKTNNLKLTQALQDSKVNVTAWEKELTGLRKENTELKLKLASLETKDDRWLNEQEEIDKYKLQAERIQKELQKEIQSKDSIIESLQKSLSTTQLQQKESERSNGPESTQNLKVKEELQFVHSQIKSKLESLDELQHNMKVYLAQLR